MTPFTPVSGNPDYPPSPGAAWWEESLDREDERWARRDRTWEHADHLPAWSLPVRGDDAR